MDATVVCIDETKESVQIETRTAWFPRGTRPSVELSGLREWACLLGTTTDDGDRYVSRFEEYLTAGHAEHFISILYYEFKYDSPVVLDEAPYLQASTVTDPAASDDFASVTLPSYSPAESCRGVLETAASGSD